MENPFFLAVGTIMVALLMVTGVVILFGHYVMSAMTASDPDADPGRLMAVTFAALLFVAGAAVMFTRGRDR